MGGQVACLDIKWRRITSKDYSEDLVARRLNSLTMVEGRNAGLQSKQ